MSGASEADWEDITLDRVSEHGWETLPGSQIAPGTDNGRESWAEIHLPARMLASLVRLNPAVPLEYLRQALSEITTPTSQDALVENERIHRFLVGGYRGISYTDLDGVEQNPTIHLVGGTPELNEWLAVNQVTVKQGDHQRRYDVVLYLNGMPVVVIELKKAGSEHADLAAAHAQLRTYLHELPLTFRFCVLSVVSDGLQAAYGTPFTPFEHYAPWNVDDDGKVVDLTIDVADLDLGVES